MSSFSEVLQQLGGGRTYQELGDKLTEIVQAVIDTRKVGELSVTLKIKANGETGVIVAEIVKSKVPEAARGETVFYATSAGHLMRNDPRQENLPLRRIEAAMPQTIRTIETEVVRHG